MDNQNLKIKNLEEKIAEMENRLSRIEGVASIGNAPKRVDKTLSIKEFVLSKKPADDSQKILVAAYFLEKYDQSTSFNVKDLVKGFERAKERMPANINDRVNKIIANTGHIMETKEKKENLKAWTLTNSGERFVEENLPSEK